MKKTILTVALALALTMTSVYALTMTMDVDELKELTAEKSLGGFYSPMILDPGLQVETINQTFNTGTSTVTLRASDSGKTFYLVGSSTQITLPAAEKGMSFTFQVSGAIVGGGSIDGDYHIVSAETANIYGALLTGGVDYACSAEDQINIITDGEVPGDYIILVSDGTNWYLQGAEATTDAKLTCTT